MNLKAVFKRPVNWLTHKSSLPVFLGILGGICIMIAWNVSFGRPDIPKHVRHEQLA